MKKKLKKTKPKKKKNVETMDGFLAYQFWKAQNRFGAEYETPFTPIVKT